MNSSTGTIAFIVKRTIGMVRGILVVIDGHFNPCSGLGGIGAYGLRGLGAFLYTT